MPKKQFRRTAICALSLLLLLSLYALPALAWVGPKIPTYDNYTWEVLSGVTATEPRDTAFVIHTQAGSHAVSLYLTFPTAGGFRLRLSEEANRSGYFDIPASAVTYQQRADGVYMTGKDGTGVLYSRSAAGFSLSLYNEKGKKLVSLTEKQISLAFRNGKDSIIKMLIELPLADTEAVYNGAERYSSVDLVGTDVNLYNVDAAYHGDSGSVNRPDAYINSPFFHSNRGYSVWFNMAYGGKADIGKANAHKLSFLFEGGEKLDFVMWAGTVKQNIAKYTQITGTSIVPEKWVFRYWMGGGYAPWNYDYTGNGYLNLKSVIDGYSEMGIKNIAAYFCEGLFENASCNQLLRQNGSRMLMWFGAYEQKKSAIQSLLPNTPYAELPFAHNVNAYKQLSTSDFLDFSNPLVVDAVTAQLTTVWNYGVQGAMDDFGEYLPYDTICYNGLTGLEMHNLISVYYGSSMAKAWSARFGNDYILFQRSGFSGSQKYTANFLGDQAGNWRGLRDQVYATVSMGMGGFNIYGGDIGGLSGKVDNDTYVRWYQFAAFEPLMRTHGNSELHLPWEKGAVAKINFPAFYWLRENLLDTIYSSAVEAHETANPMVQALAVTYPYQRRLSTVDDTYVFCNNFLVSPVISPKTFARQVAFPKGTWYSLWDYSAVSGGDTQMAEAPTTFIPVYLRSGSVSPVTLPASLELTDSMQDRATFGGLLITPPEARRKNCVYDTADRRTVYTNQNASETTFTVTADKASDRTVVLLYGVTASAVQADGKALPRLEGIPDVEENEQGYYVDAAGRTVAVLPTGWKQLEVEKGKSRYYPLEMTSEDARVTRTLLDDDLNTVFSFDNSSSAMTVQFNGLQEVNRVDVRFTNAYASSFDVEYSEDGVQWHTVATKKNSIGGIEVIDFDTVSAAYLRITNVQSGDAGRAAIYRFAAYNVPIWTKDDNWSGDTVTPEYEPETDDNWDSYPDDETITDEDGTTVVRHKKPGKKYLTTVYETPVWVWILIGGGVLVLLTGGVLLLLMRRRKRQRAAAEAEKE